MSAQAVVTAEQKQSGAAKQLAPAASLAGMRLWKEPGEAAPAKSECLAGTGKAETSPQLAALLGWETVEPIIAASPAANAADAEPATEAAPAELVIAEGGLPPHVSPFPQRARDDRRRDSDILGYWARIRGDRDMPAWTDLDQNQIAFFWPNSFLLSCVSRHDRGAPLISRATRIVDDDGMADRSADLAFTPPMVSWIMSTSADVASIAMPLEESRTFRNEDGARLTCDLVAMPLSQTGERVDYVLCHVKPH